MLLSTVSLLAKAQVLGSHVSNIISLQDLGFFEYYLDISLIWKRNTWDYRQWNALGNQAYQNTVRRETLYCSRYLKTYFHELISS